MNRVLDMELPKDEQNEEEGIYTVGEDIASQFYYGNWNNAVEMMKEVHIEPKEFYEFLETMAHDIDGTLSDIYGGHFDTMFFIELQKEMK